MCIRQRNHYATHETVYFWIFDVERIGIEYEYSKVDLSAREKNTLMTMNYALGEQINRKYTCVCMIIISLNKNKRKVKRCMRFS